MYMLSEGRYYQLYAYHSTLEYYSYQFGDHYFISCIPFAKVQNIIYMLLAGPKLLVVLPLQANVIQFIFALVCLTLVSVFVSQDLVIFLVFCIKGRGMVLYVILKRN